jgi:hypothetical protein
MEPNHDQSAVTATRFFLLNVMEGTSNMGEITISIAMTLLKMLNLSPR